jgi:hypothetical protein
MSAKTPITGKTIIAAACHDLERFYKSSSKLKVRVEYDQAMRNHVSFSGNLAGSRIRFSKDFCDFEIALASDYHFALIQTCHELAHYLNKHNRHEDVDEADTKALETWADFFGARIFMVLISYGARSRKFVFGLDPGADQGEQLAHIGSGLRQVYDHVYKGAPTDVYPDAEERVHVFIAGIGSFFMRAFGEFKADWSVFCFDHIMRGGEF